MSMEEGACCLPKDAQEDRLQGKSILDQKGKKKANRIIESIIRDLPNSDSHEEKLHLLCHKFHALSVEHKETLQRVKQLEITIKSVCHERDQLQNETNRLILQKDKLETLCREVQKQSKTVEGESLARARAEDEKRRQVSDHFQTSIAGIQKQLNEYQTRNSSLHKENQELAEKLKLFIEQHERRESHINKLIETRNLEVKLGEAKLQQAQCQLDKETTTHRHQVAGLQHAAKAMEERLDAHLEVEKKLREQVEFYKVKYQEFNKAMANNNRLFESTKSEMEKFAKRIRQSDRDITEWRGKWELSQRSLLEVVDEVKRKERETAAAEKKVERLTGLCRALQTQLAEVRRGSQPVGDGGLDLSAVGSGGEEQVISEVGEADGGVSPRPEHPESDPPKKQPVIEEEEPVLVEKPSAEVAKTEEPEDQSWVAVPPSDSQP